MTLAVQSFNQPQIIKNHSALKQSNNRVQTHNSPSFTGFFKTGTKAGIVFWEVFSYASAAGALAIGLLLDTHVVSIGTHALEPIQKAIFSYTHIHVGPSLAAYAETISASIQAVGCTFTRRKLNKLK